jgi:hypothetical protein
MSEYENYEFSDDTEDYCYDYEYLEDHDAVYQDAR